MRIPSALRAAGPIRAWGGPARSWPSLPPRVDQLDEVGRRGGDEALVVELAGEPVARRLHPQRSADGEAAYRRDPLRLAEPLHQLRDRRALPEQHDAAAERVALGDQRRDLAPLRGRHRRELPPLRRDADVVEPLDRAEYRVGGERRHRRRDYFEQQLVAAGLAGIGERMERRLLLEAQVDRIVGMERDEALDDVLGGPRPQRRAERAAVLELERPAAGQLDGPADPPAAAGRGVERVGTVDVVDQDADAAAQFLALGLDARH